MPQIKICPDCNAEFFHHVQNCTDCGAALLLPEENRKLQEERDQCKDKMIKNAVAVKEGDLDWIDELYNMLLDASVPCVIKANIGCGCSGQPYALLVSTEDAERANELIEEHYAHVHPEIEASNDLVNNGKCPACGSPVGPNEPECRDCGLTLMIIE
jgi:ribosomal protein L40E